MKQIFKRLSFSQISTVVRQFPVTLVLCFSLFIAGFILEEERFRDSILLNNLVKVLLVLIPLSYTYALNAINKQYNLLKTLGVIPIIAAAGLGYTYILPQQTADLYLEAHIVRLLMLVTVGLVSVTIALPQFRSQNKIFWSWNISLILHALITMFFGLILFIGLSLAFLALEKLFAITIPVQRYFQLFLFIASVISPVFFLSGLPESKSNILESVTFTNKLKLFAQYILGTITLIYSVILISYLIKIVLLWSWPNGWVSRLIVSYYVTGICSFLLISQFLDSANSNRFKYFFRFFFVLNLPLAVVLVLAVGVRISEHGLTESRVLGYVTAGWISVISVYLLLKKDYRISIIPISLLILLVPLSIGPLSIFSIAKNNQIDRLKSELIQMQILKNGKIFPNNNLKISQQKVAKIGGILRYLYHTHGYSDIQSWFSQSLLAAGSKNQRYIYADSILSIMGFEDDYPERQFALTFQPSHASAVSIESYSSVFSGLTATGNRLESQGDQKTGYFAEIHKDTLKVMHKELDKEPVVSCLINCRPLILECSKYKNKGKPILLDDNLLSIESSSNNRKLLCLIQELTLFRSENETTINNIVFNLYY